ncbi:MAG: hypothetical protein EOO15_06540 [Chitinophagaceae bacterium]|nr:MAG: hypothetical protein EOO15_06540 [Chitinophagaceae bacterium]
MIRNFMHPELIAIQEEISTTFSEESLDQLELLVTRYSDFLGNMATPRSDCSYYRGALRQIEESLEDARYGNNEAQRARGYQRAFSLLQGNIEEFSKKFQPAENELVGATTSASS